MGNIEINVVLIDDEEPALLEMEFLLKNYLYVNVIGKFTNPIAALEKIKELKPHVVFLDINMPQIGGMTVARRLLENKEHTEFVFVTAYDQYAVEAFEVKALDYLLKPISMKRLDQTIERIMSSRSLEDRSVNKRLEIKSMGHFQVCRAGEAPLKWRTEKEKELFAFLLHNKDQEISKDRIIDQLWNEYEIGKAAHQLHNSIYYIRKSLEEYGVSKKELYISKRYCLNIGDVFYDRKTIETQMGNSGKLMLCEDLEVLLQLFRGRYLEFEDWTWAGNDREVLAKHEIDLLISLSEKYMEAGSYNKAEMTLKKAFGKDPFEERITHLLLVLYKKNGDKVKAAKHYMEYQKLLKDELEIIPRDNIRRIYELIKNEQ